MMDKTLTTLTESACALGESPVWDTANNRLYWVDTLNGTLHWFDFSDQTSHSLHFEQKIGSVALAGQNRLIGALQKGFYYIDIKKRSLKKIAEIQNEPESNRFNDGKCDAAGRFWAGTMSETGTLNAAKLYVLGNERKVDEKLAGVSCSNGLAWSPDNRIMYYIDSLSYEVVAYDFDVNSGEICKIGTAIKFSKEQGIPDGMTIDVEGGLWIAMWNAGNVSRFDPFSGRLLDQIKLPVTQVSSCTFGGASLSDLFVTTAAVGLTKKQKGEQPLAGCTFHIHNLGVSGVIPDCFLSKV